MGFSCIVAGRVVGAEAEMGNGKVATGFAVKAAAWETVAGKKCKT